MAQILSQEEVDALLRGISGGEIETKKKPIEDEEGVQRFDFTNQDRIIRGRMPTLEMIHDRFVRLFRTTISSALRRSVDISVVSTEMIKFGEFMRSIPLPTSLNLFKMDPLRGYALLVLEGKLVFALVDNFFGGKGKTNVKLEGREFTSIEQRLIKKIVGMVLSDYNQAWKPVYEVQVEFIRTEINPQFVTLVQPSDVVISIILEVEMEEIIGRMTMCIPYSMVEPIRDKLKSGFQSDLYDIDKTCTKRLVAQLKESRVNVRAKLGDAVIKGRDLLHLKKGDIIQLRQTQNVQLDVFVEDILKFRGYVGSFNGNKAIKISEVLPSRRSVE